MKSFVDYRKGLILASQILLLTASYYGSFLLRCDFSISAFYAHVFLETLPVILICELVVFHAFGLTRGWWRYTGISDVMDIIRASFTATVILYVLFYMALHVDGYPRSILAINSLLNIMFIGGARLVVRAYTEMATRTAAASSTLIVGAGAAGSMVARELRKNSSLQLRPIGFVDEDKSKIGIRIHGLRVLETCDHIPEILQRFNVRCVLIAIPSATGKQIERILALCRECKVDIKILPPLSQQINGGHPSIAHLREPRVEDLLGRPSVQTNLAGIQKQLQGKTVLITGAGGSIGSELSRQMCGFGPARLILVDRSENCLFKLGMDLNTKHPHQQFVPVIADIQDARAMREVFALYRPNLVFHAAAYKHVPLMEHSPFQAVANNIFGTYNVAMIARQFSCESFVMISSDKAVRPTNIMGVTKRVAELLILALQKERTRYVAVRFGNVLGSNGSVVPIFQEQIAGGGPVTVTHPDARRYFMTIPEAVQLVLQASSMGGDSEIFVLEMGEQVRIADLARSLIRLSGYEPDRDIPIIYTGLRPGEKLAEELMLDAEGLKPTTHPKIRILDGGSVSFEQVGIWLDELADLLETKNVSGTIQALKRIVPEYQPSEEVLAMCEIDRHDMGLSYTRARRQLLDSAHTVGIGRA